jgi:hypothetical protein
MASESHCGAAFWSGAPFFFVESYYLQCAIMNSAFAILPIVVHRRNKQFNRRSCMFCHRDVHDHGKQMESKKWMVGQTLSEGVENGL